MRFQSSTYLGQRRKCLVEELPQQTAAASAERGADGELSLTMGGAGEEEVRDVDAGYGEKESDGGEKDEQWSFSDVGEMVAETNHQEAVGVIGRGGLKSCNRIDFGLTTHHIPQIFVKLSADPLSHRILTEQIGFEKQASLDHRIVESPMALLYKSRAFLNEVQQKIPT